MRRRLFEKLACPACKGPLTLSEGAFDGEDRCLQGALACAACGIAYPVKEGIPFFEIAQADDKDSAWNQVFSGADPESVRKDVERTRANVASGMAAQGCLISRLLARDGTPLKRFLDIGCGSGFFSWYNHSVRPELELTLLDYSVPGILRAALTMREAGVDADLVQGNAFKLPFKADAFDASSTSGLLEHFDRGQQDTILREQARVGTHNYCQAPVDTLGYWILRRWVTWRLGKWPFGFEEPLKKTFFVELLEANGWRPKARSAQSLFTAFALHILKLRVKLFYRLLSPLERMLDYDVCWLCERR